MHSPGFFPKGYLCKPFNGGYDMVQALAGKYKFNPTTTPWNQMSPQARNAFLFGDPEPIRVNYTNRAGKTHVQTVRFPGFYGWIRDWDVGGTYTDTQICAACGGGNQTHVTAVALTRLGYLGFDASFPPVKKAAEFLFSLQQSDGSWSLSSDTGEADESESYSMVPLQTALPFRGLAGCGYAADPRAEKAFTWLLAQRLEDGAWPTGIAAGNFGRVAGYRKLPHSRWGCRSNTTGALICLACHSQHRHGAAARRALDLLLARETRETYPLEFEVARIIGVEPVRGFFTRYARFDLALLLDLCWKIGASTADERVTALVDFLRNLQGTAGLWHYATYPQVNRWLTFDLLRSLARIDSESDWIRLEPKTPFKAYLRKSRRF